METRRLTPDEKDEIRSLLRSGRAQADVADIFGITRSAVEYYARQIEGGDEARSNVLPWDAQPWSIDAVCAETDPEAFFPEKGGSTRQAKALCATCRVQAECLDWALDRDERFGVWGGLSERERRKLKAALSDTTQPEQQESA